MDRLIATGTVAAGQADAAPVTGTPGFATDGNPAGNIPASQWPAYQYNAIQEELMAIIGAASITPDRNKNNLVVAAIRRLLQMTPVLADTGALNAYAAVNPTALVAGASPTWVDGVAQAVKIAHTNTGPSTYAPDGLPAIPIYGLGLQPLQAGELLLNSTAILMRTTIAGVNGGNPICVLMECAGGTQQIAAATQSGHAVQLGQFTGLLAAPGCLVIPMLVGGVLKNVFIQWGQGVANSSGILNVTWPLAFPTSFLWSDATIAISSPSPYIATCASVPGNAAAKTTGVFGVTNGSGTAAAVTISWISIGF